MLPDWLVIPAFAFIAQWALFFAVVWLNKRKEEKEQ